MPEIAHLRERLATLGLPALAEEGTVMHIHEHLDIFVHGKQVPVPADIGVSERERFISPIHTHDEKAIIHVESPTKETFTLGQFFDIWGVQFKENCIADSCADATSTLRVYSNGKEVAGDPRTLVLEPRQEIVVTFGTKAEEPASIASSYVFDMGL